MSTDEELTLYGSVSGLITAWLAPLLLVGVAILAWWRVPRISVGLVLVVGLAALLAAAAVFDFPLRTILGHDGLTRCCLARRHRLGWAEVSAIRRGRGAILSNRLRHDRSARAAGPLVAVVGRRNYLLVDRCESQAEHDRLVSLLSRYSSQVRVLASRPSVGVPPTGLYWPKA